MEIEIAIVIDAAVIAMMVKWQANDRPPKPFHVKMEVQEQPARVPIYFRIDLELKQKSGKTAGRVVYDEVTKS